jgi:uncharacterized protein (TIGR02266 family)
MRVEYDSLTDFLDDYTSNLSMGGMYVQSNQPLPIGTRFRLRFRLPGREKAIETYAIVRWVSETTEDEHSGMGIQFDKLRNTDQKSIEKWLIASEP